jgi:hypothetical protein
VASFMSLLRPGTLRMCMALARTRVKCSSSTCHTGFQYTPVDSIALWVTCARATIRRGVINSPVVVPKLLLPANEAMFYEAHACDDELLVHVQSCTPRIHHLHRDHPFSWGSVESASSTAINRAHGQAVPPPQFGVLAGPRSNLRTSS